MYGSQQGSYNAGLVEKVDFFGHQPMYSAQVNYSFSTKPALDTVNYSVLEQQISSNYNPVQQSATTGYTINLDQPLPVISDKVQLDLAYGLGYASSQSNQGPQDFYSDTTAYESIENTLQYTTQPSQRTVRFVPDTFLLPDRPATPFIGKAQLIQDHVRSAFEKTTGFHFSEEMFQLQVARLDEFKEFFFSFSGGSDQPQQFSLGILGFCINRYPQTSYIFVREDNLDRLFLTIGHEIGHALSPILSDPRDEEAKAFAFSLAWMKTVVEHNIANLSHNITPNPARNDLHDVAYSFVLEQMQKHELSPWDVYCRIRDKLIQVGEGGVSL